MKYKYFDIIMALSVAVLLISNIASTKIITVFGFSFDAGTLMFPLAYVLGDLITEVYGLAKARRVIWTGFFSVFLMSLSLMLVVKLPAASDWPHQDTFANIIGLTPRIAFASLLAYLLGSRSNAYIMHLLKQKTRGRLLWFRTIASTLAGEGIDTFIFIFIAFYATLPTSLLFSILFFNYIFKVSFEIVFTPFIYTGVRLLNKFEKKATIKQ